MTHRGGAYPVYFSLCETPALTPTTPLCLGIFPASHHSCSGCIANALPPSLFTWGAIAKCHGLGSLNNRHLFLTVLEATSARLRLGRVGFLEGFFSWFADSCLLPLSSLLRRYLCREKSSLSLYSSSLKATPSCKIRTPSISLHLTLIPS